MHDSVGVVFCPIPIRGVLSVGRLTTAIGPLVHSGYCSTVQFNGNDSDGVVFCPISIRGVSSVGQSTTAAATGSF